MVQWYWEPRGIEHVMITSTPFSCTDTALKTRMCHIFQPTRYVTIPLDRCLTGKTSIWSLWANICWGCLTRTDQRLLVWSDRIAFWLCLTWGEAQIPDLCTILWWISSVCLYSWVHDSFITPYRTSTSPNLVILVQSLVQQVPRGINYCSLCFWWL